MNILASIQIIKNISSIENADKIECADVLGYKSVIEKNKFKIGDKIVFIGLDAIVPDKPEFQFLKKYNFRIKTVKLRRQISQGIIMPLSILPSDIAKYNINDDVTEVLQITHYEKLIPLNMGGENRGGFPYYIRRTDEENILNFPEIVNELIGKTVYITIKIDGTSASFSNRDGDIHVCSRSLSKKEGQSVYWKIAEKYNLIEKLKNLGNYCIQGEIAGPSIQKNSAQLTEVDLFVFDIWDIDKQKYVGMKTMFELCEKLELQTVPLIYMGTFNYVLDELINLATYQKYKNTNNDAEGIVVRTIEEQYSNVMKGRMSFKIINPNYKD